MNGSKLDIINKQIREFQSELRYLEAGLSGSKSLIISTGDISDVDGLYALAEYAKTGSDVMFIMNFPSYVRSEVGVIPRPPLTELSEGPDGLGYTYGARAYFEESHKFLKTKVDQATFESYMRLYYSYAYEQVSTRGIKCAFVDIAFDMITSVWAEAKSDGKPKGKIYLCVGGINSVNPFSASSLKNELYVYREFLRSGKRLNKCDEGWLIDMDGAGLVIDKSDFVNGYTEVFLDFNGSMAFLSRSWIQILRNTHARDALKGFFVMGGVHSYDKARTMPSIKNTLNRLSCATMNQLYSPVETGRIFTLMAELQVPVFTVSNNSVEDVETFADEDKKIKTDDGWRAFLTDNLIMSDRLAAYASDYYNSRVYNPPRKPFDFYTAVALLARLAMNRFGSNEYLFYDSKYGVTLISKKDTWTEALAEYESNIDVTLDDQLPDFEKNKRLKFVVELQTLKAHVSCLKIPILNVMFKKNDKGRLRVKHEEVRQVDKYLDFYIFNYHAANTFWGAKALKKLTGYDVFETKSKWHLRIVFPSSDSSVYAICDDGRHLTLSGTPRLQTFGSGYRAVDWGSFFRHYNAAQPNASAKVKYFSTGNLDLELSVEGFGAHVLISFQTPPAK